MARKMIETLMPEHEALLVKYREEGLRYGLSTDRADRPRAEAAITRMYQLIDKPAPKFVWVDSPASACVFFGLLRLLPDRAAFSAIESQLRDMLIDSVSACSRRDVDRTVLRQLRQGLTGNSNEVDQVERASDMLMDSLMRDLHIMVDKAEVKLFEAQTIAGIIHLKLHDLHRGALHKTAYSKLGSELLHMIYHADTLHGTLYDATNRPVTAIGERLKQTANDAAINWVDSVLDGKKNGVNSLLLLLKSVTCRSMAGTNYGSISRSLDDKLFEFMFRQMYTTLYDSVHIELRNNLFQTDASVYERSVVLVKLREILRDALGVVSVDCMMGQFEVYWITYYRFCEALGVEYKPKDRELLGLWTDVSHSCGWWWPRDGVVICSERPTRCCVNARDVLHSDDGPALEYPDGFALWSLDGVSLPTEHGRTIVLTPDKQTIEEIDNEPNEEVRRIRLERFGWARYFREAKVVLIDSRRNDVDGTTEVLVSDVRGVRRLLCTCRSTGRQYAPSVPEAIQTCAEAQTWMKSGSRWGRLSMTIGAS